MNLSSIAQAHDSEETSNSDGREGSSELPNGWVSVNLPDIGELSRGKSKHRPRDEPRLYVGPYPFIQTGDIRESGGTIRKHSQTYSELGLSQSQLWPLGTLCITIAANIGETGILSYPACFPDSIVGFRHDGDPTITRFIEFYVRIAKSELARLAPATAQKNINVNILSKLPVPFPPLAEQRRIVEKVEELFSELDKGIENLKQARAQLAVYRQALLKHAFEGKLTADWRGQKLTNNGTAAWYLSSLRKEKTTARKFESQGIHSIESWAFAALDELTDYITSGSRGWADFYSEQGSLFIRAQNLNRDKLDLSDIAHVNLPKGAEGTRTMTRAGDVFVTITGANVTKAGYLDRDIGEAFVSQHVALCRPLDPSLSEYLYLYIISNWGGRKDLERAAYGAGKPGLNLDNLRSLEIPIPPPDEIPIVVEEVRTAMAAVDALEADINANLQKAEALRQSILKKAFSGELVPQDPADEPASALLVRIRAERAVAAAAPKIKTQPSIPRRNR